jgi:hypothetical protein
VNSIEHPGSDFAAFPTAIALDVASEHGPCTALDAVHDDVLTVQPVPGVVHAPNIGLVITLIGACTISSEIIKASTTDCSARSQRRRTRTRIQLHRSRVANASVVS